MKTEWHEPLAAFKKYYGYKNADLARMSGNTLQSVKNISQGEVPGWLKFAIQVWQKNQLEMELNIEQLLADGFALETPDGNRITLNGDGTYSLYLYGKVLEFPTLQEAIDADVDDIPA